MLGSANVLRHFSNQVEKQEDASHEDVQQQVDNEVAASEGADEDASEPPLVNNVSETLVHAMFIKRYGSFKLKNMPQRIRSMDASTFEFDIEKLESNFVNACGSSLNKQ